jgi:hypothetical protein
MLLHHAHGDAATVGEAEHVRAGGAIVADKRGDVVGEKVGLQRGDGQISDWRGAGAAAAASKVEQHDVSLVGKLGDWRQQVE